MISLFLFSLLIIGLVQVIGSLIRAVLIKDWTSEYAIGLKLYFKILLVYIICHGSCLYVPDFGIELPNMLGFLIYIVSPLIAVYYWLVIFRLKRSPSI